MKIILIFILGLFSLTGYAQKSSFSLHKVEKGQTLYGISKIYGQNIEDIKKLNTNIDFNNLKYGQEIKIPATSKPIDNKVANTTSAAGKTPLYNLTHVVKSNESLYSIAKMYAISIDLLSKTNNISNGTVQIGQSLVIPGSTGTAVIIKAENSKNIALNVKDKNNNEVVPIINNNTKIVDEDIDMTDPTTNNLNNAASKSIAMVKVPISNVESKAVEESKTPENFKDKSEYKVESDAYRFSLIANKPFAEQFGSYAANGSLNRKTNKGVASYMKEASDVPNYIAMYNGSPIGSVVKVKNLMNGHVVYVKIIGKLPDLDKNKDLNIKVSESAAKALGVVDDKFLNEIEYYTIK